MLDLLVKTLTKWYTIRCPICKTTRIEVILNSFKEKIFCPECSKHIIFGRVPIKILMSCINIDSKEIIDLSSENETMPLVNALFRGISKNGLKAIKIGIPLYIIFDVTNKCNLNCIHCYTSSKNEELKTNDVYQVIDKLYEAGAGIIDFGGGEPLLRDDIIDILTYSKDVGLYTSISTNGTLFNKDCIKNLKKVNLNHISISLDGAKPETHDFIRNKKGTFKKTIDGIKNCVNNGINTEISTVFMRGNINELEDIYNLLNSLNVNGWYVYDFIPAGRGRKLQDEMLNSDQRRQLFVRLQEFAISSKMSIKPYPYSVTINSACGKNTYFYKKYGKLTELFRGCLAARWICHISSNGDVHACHLLPQKLGNLKHQDFREIWFNNSNHFLMEIRDRSLLKGKCGMCKYKKTCGGCRARAFWTTGNYLESDSCWIKT